VSYFSPEHCGRRATLLGTQGAAGEIKLRWSCAVCDQDWLESVPAARARSIAEREEGARLRRERRKIEEQRADAGAGAD
jgi:hypothetical protein